MLTLAIWNTVDEAQSVPLPCAGEKSKVAIMENCVLVACANELNCFELPWPSDFKSLEFNEQVIEVACNLNLALILTRQSIWALGCDKLKCGLFGDEEVFESIVPYRLKSFTNNVVLQVSISEKHAAAICDQGMLYTWGTGLDGELGEKGLEKSLGKVVGQSGYYRPRQVVVGKGFTSIVTEGGFLYTYRNGNCCSCSNFSDSLYPFPLLCLDQHFITKAVTYNEGLALLTSTGKVFLSYNCQCTSHLKTNKNIVDIASFNNKVIALSADKSRIYAFEEKEEDIESQVMELKTGKVTELYSSLTGFFGILSVNDLNFEEYEEISSPEISPRYCHQDKENLEALLEKYNLSPNINHEIISQEKACKTITSIFSKFLAEVFRKIKEIGYLKIMMQRAYVKSCIPAILLKVVNRVNFIYKNWAFNSLFHSNSNYAQDQQEIFSFSSCFKKIIYKRIKFNLLILMNPNSLCLSLLQPTTGRLNFSKNTQSSFIFLLKLNKISLSLSSNLIKTIEKRKKSSSLAKWRTICPNVKFETLISKVLNPKLQKVFLSLILPESKNCIKFGLFFLSASLSKILSKLKSFSFNSILRHKPKFQCIESLSLVLFQLYRPNLHDSFNSIRVHSMTKKHKNIIRLIFSGQRLFEKVKYRMVIKGFNSFKRNLFSKSILSDLSSENSFKLKKAYQIFTSSRFETPSNEMTMPNTERSTLETSSFSSGRKASMQRPIKAQSRKIQTSAELRPSVMTKSKVYEKQKKAGLDKRLAYQETLKERQKKNMMIKGQIIHKSNKSLSALSLRADDFDKQTWIRNKYLNGCLEMARVLMSATATWIRLPFYMMKFRIDCKSKNLRVQTKYLTIDESNKVYDSPIESPIAVVNDDNYTLPPTPFVEMLSPKASCEISLWKVKIYNLGLNKFSRSVRKITSRFVWKFICGNV